MNHKHSPVWFKIEDVFTFTGRGIVLVGITDSEWEWGMIGSEVVVTSMSGEISRHQVKGLEIPNWIKKPPNSRYGVLVSHTDIDDFSD